MGKNEKKALELILEFAKAEPDVAAVHEGVDPEDGQKGYYFLVPSPWDPQFQDRMTELDLRIYRETGVDYFIMSWPVEGKEQGFVHKSIWKRG